MKVIGRYSDLIVQTPLAIEFAEAVREKFRAKVDVLDSEYGIVAIGKWIDGNQGLIYWLKLARFLEEWEEVSSNRN